VGPSSLRRPAALAAAAIILVLAALAVLFAAGVLPPGDDERGQAGTFAADFESGDLSGWSQENVLESRQGEGIRVVEGDARQGRYAARFEVAPGDRPDAGNDLDEDGSGERAELARTSRGEEQEGDEFWYTLAFRLPDDWTQVADGWRIPFQFHSVNDDLDGRSPVPPVALDFIPPSGRPQGEGEGGLWLEVHGGDLSGDDFAEGNEAEVLPLPIRTGVWHDIVMRVRWGRDDGAVTVWHRAEGEVEFVERTKLEGIPTLLYITSPETRVSRVFIRTGLYRAPSDDRTDVIELDAISRATSFDAAASAFDG
jgi:hypothetical protein